MLSIFQKARAGENLSPAARSFLRLLEGLAATAIVAALPAVSDALAHGVVNWADVGQAALAAGSTAAILALLKYCKAHADLPLTPAQPDTPPPAPLAPLAAVSVSDTSAAATATPVVAPDPNASIVTPDGAVA